MYNASMAEETANALLRLPEPLRNNPGVWSEIAKLHNEGAALARRQYAEGVDKGFNRGWRTWNSFFTKTPVWRRPKPGELPYGRQLERLLAHEGPPMSVEEALQRAKKYRNLAEGSRAKANPFNTGGAEYREGGDWENAYWNAIDASRRYERYAKDLASLPEGFRSSPESWEYLKNTNDEAVRLARRQYGKGAAKGMAHGTAVGAGGAGTATAGMIAMGRLYNYLAGTGKRKPVDNNVKETKNGTVKRSP